MGSGIEFLFVLLSALLFSNITPARDKRKPDVINIGILFSGTNEGHMVRRMIERAVDKVNDERAQKQQEYRDSWVTIPYLETELERIDSGDPDYTVSRKLCNLTAKGVAAIVGPNMPIPSSTENLVSQFSEHLQLPHLTCSSMVSRVAAVQPKFSVNLSPSINHFCTAMVDVLEYFEWRSFVFIYDSPDRLITVEGLITQRSGLASEIHPIQMRKFDPEEAYELLQFFREKRWTRVMVDLTLSNTKILLQAALNLGMINRDYHYILTNLDALTLPMFNYQHNYANITAFTLSGVNFTATMETILANPTKTPFFSDDVLSTRALLAYDSALILGRAIQSTLGPMRTLQLPEVGCANVQDKYTLSSFGLSLFNEINTAHLADGLSGRVDFIGSQRNSLALDIYHIAFNGGMKKVGHWSLRHRIKMTENPYDVQYIFPLKNKVLRVVTVLQSPFVQEKLDAASRDGRDKYEGYCIDMMESIANRSGFEWTIYVESNNTYGTLENGQWTGMVHELLAGNADIALGAFTISYIRERVIDFTKPFMNLGISILFKKPKGEKPGIFSFLNPLATVIWLYVMAAYLVVTLIIYTIARFSPYEWVHPYDCEDSDYVQNNFTLSNSFWFTLGTLLQQGSDVNPRSVSTRLVGGIWWFFTLIIISSYTANLAAFLTIDQMVSPIENAEGLSRQTSIKYGVLQGGSTMSFFKNSHIDTYKRMWAKMRANKNDVFTSSTSQGIERVKTENYAFLMESAMIEYYKERDSQCSLIQVGGLIDSKGYGIGVAPNLTGLQDEMTLRILQLQWDQRLHALENKWWRDSGTCRGKDSKGGSTANPLDINNVGGIFVVLCVGLTIGIIVAIVEFVCSSRHNAAHKPNNSVWQEMRAELGFALNCYASSRRFKHTRQTSQSAASIKMQRSRSQISSGSYETPAPRGIMRSSSSAASMTTTRYPLEDQMSIAPSRYQQEDQVSFEAPQVRVRMFDMNTGNMSNVNMSANGSHSNYKPSYEARCTYIPPPCVTYTESSA